MNESWALALSNCWWYECRLAPYDLCDRCCVSIVIEQIRLCRAMSAYMCKVAEVECTGQKPEGLSARWMWNPGLRQLLRREDPRS